MVTLSDVSKEAGVSSSTVSRVMNGNKKISEETRKKVMEAAKKLNYKPNTNLIENRTTTNTIGVIASCHISDYFYFPALESIFEKVEHLGYKVLFCRLNTTYGLEPNFDILQDLEDKVDGVVFVGNFRITENELKAFIDNNIPIVSLFGYIDVPGIAHVITNNFQAGYDATSYLINIGHKRIGHIMSNRSFIHSIERMNGYIKALKDNNIVQDESLIAVGNYTFEEAYQASLNFIDSNKFTAVFCFSDIIASAFIRACKERNIKVPEDISVIGIDDITYENNLINKDIIPITTMRQPRKEMADYAIRILLQKLRGIDTFDRKVYDPILIERNSTMPRK
ncbi:LacI family DNA-binding transcriptional regulator [Clostridium sp. YIM B02505]|uniref:LacI family DNA-binding transcriptional regulator n=1 Tax=Clostridium yunnanense TaxID=2800325 RepID=A0ABS1EK04_9CLOT|nr:LacI family DNA-binding transcriptional regulator [Clostridium yunnanense]MBK1809689.1 LacI family DNA-binding transcriptional regulator [Clostridium yunnanense]